MLPSGQSGLKSGKLGPVNAEQNIFQMNSGAIYCMYRTISGYPAESYSYNKENPGRHLRFQCMKTGLN